MKFTSIYIRKIGFIALAASVLLSLTSCQSSKKIMEEESLTGIYEIRSSGLFNKSYTFASYTIQNISVSGKPTKSTLRHEGASKTSSSLGVSFTMKDENGFKWSGIGSIESESVSLAEKSKSSNTLIYKFRISESQTGRIIRYELNYNPLAENFNGFMKGTVVDEDGNGLFDIYSSNNLNFTASPSDAISGFSIRKGDEVLSSIIKTHNNWSVTYNVAEDDPLRIELSALVSSLFVLIEEGKI